MLYPTNRCNLRCAICWQRWVTPDFEHEVPDARLLDLVDEAAALGVRTWTLCGGGEPMVRADLVMNLCERICDRGMNGALQTNATLFSKDHLEHLIRMGWSRIVVSLDGPTREVNDAIRSPGSFDKATASLRTLGESKRRQGSELPHVSLHTVPTSMNYDRLDQMVDLAHDFGCDTVGVSSLAVGGKTCEPFRLRAEHRADLSAHVHRAMSRAQALGIEENFATVLPGAAHRPPQRHPQSQEAPRPGTVDLAEAACFEPWHAVTILADGKVGPCCVFWDEAADSIENHSLREVWTGPYLERVRAQILLGDLPSYCVHCPSILRVQTDSFRERLRWRQMSGLGRVGLVARKAIASVRRYGVWRALRRGVTWWRLDTPQ